MPTMLKCTYDEFLQLRKYVAKFPDSDKINNAETYFKIFLGLAASFLSSWLIMLIKDHGWDNYQIIFIIMMIIFSGLCILYLRRFKLLKAAVKISKESLADFMDHIEVNNLGPFNVKILGAFYGANGQYFDVSEEVRRKVSKDGLKFNIIYGSFFDYVPNVPKTLIVDYLCGGERNVKSFSDGQWAEIP